MRVTGTVVEFVIPDIESEFGIDLDDDLFIDYEEEHAIVASSIVILDPAEEASLGEVTEEYAVDFQPLNESGVEGTAVVQVGADSGLDVSVEAQGLVPAQMHPQHIHLPPGDANGTCPPPDADTDGDGMISIAEGEPFYGPVVLALEPFPVATDEGEVDFQETFTTTGPDVTPLDQGVIVLHGADVDGQYDERLPVACAELD